MPNLELIPSQKFQIVRIVVITYRKKFCVTRNKFKESYVYED